MRNHGQKIGKIFHLNASQLTAQERRVFEAIKNRLHISRNVDQEFQKTLTFGQRVADRVAVFGGSWPFIFLFSGILLTWVVLNSVILVRYQLAFDPYPYILLNLFLSMLAAIQAPFIMMSQNRQAARDRMDAAHDYEVNLKAELEIAALHEKLENLKVEQLAELKELKEQQGEMLRRLKKGSFMSSLGDV